MGVGSSTESEEDTTEEIKKPPTISIRSSHELHTLFEGTVLAQAPDLFRSIFAYYEVQGRPALDTDLSVYDTPAYYGERGTGKTKQFGELYETKATTSDKFGNIFVCDTKGNQNGRIQAFTATGKYIKTLGSRHLRYPTAMLCDGDDLVVLDSAIGIVIIGQDDELKRTFGTRGRGDGQLWNPLGLTIDHDDNYCISDYQNNRIQIFDRKGNWKRKFGKEGKAAGCMLLPIGVSVDLEGRYFVAERGNNRIQVFDTKGISIRFLCHTDWAWGLAVDRDGLVVVSEVDQCKIKVFSSDGTLLKTIETSRESPPFGLCIDRHKRLLVASNGVLLVYGQNLVKLD